MCLTSVLISGIVVFVLIGIIMPIAKTRFSLETSDNPTDKTFPQLKKEYRKYQLTAVFLTLVLMPTLAYIAYKLFVAIESIVPMSPENDEIIVSPQGLYS